jgi:hypothetical protein
MNAAEVVIGMINRDHVTMVLELFGKSICQAREAPYSHPQVQVLPLYKAGGNVLGIGVPADCASADATSATNSVARYT